MTKFVAIIVTNSVTPKAAATNRLLASLNKLLEKTSREEMLFRKEVGAREMPAMPVRMGNNSARDAPK